MRLVACVLAMFLLSCTSFAAMSDINLIMSLTSSGPMNGGVRYNVAPNSVIDVMGSVEKGSDGKSDINLWADAYIGYWGVAAYYYGATESTNVCGMFAVEQPLADKVAIGVGLKLIDFDVTSRVFSVGNGADAYLVLSL